MSNYRDEHWRETAMSADQLLAVVSRGLACEGKNLSRGDWDWGWKAEVLDANTVLIARVPRGGCCRRCDRIGTRQAMPRLIWDQGCWNDFEQCGTCGSIGGINAPYRVVENPTEENIAAAVRELAGKKATR
jgi:hypothetical protein